jgi:hypothetical protein
MRFSTSKIIGCTLFGGVLLTWKYILAPLVFFSLPPKMSIPIILGLFPTWFLVLSGAIACFLRPRLALKLLVVALILTIFAGIAGAVVNGDFFFLRIFSTQVAVLSVVVVFLRRSERKSHTVAE